MDVDDIVHDPPENVDGEPVPLNVDMAAATDPRKSCRTASSPAFHTLDSEMVTPSLNGSSVMLPV